MERKVKGHGTSYGSGIQGQRLQVNVLGCRNLTDKEWFSRQDPYVIVLYGTTKFQTKTDKDGGKNPTFNERFTFPLHEGLRELKVEVWNKNNVSIDDFIGSAVVYLDKTLSSGYDDTAWVLKSKSGRTAGEVNMILHFGNANTMKEGKHDYGSAHLSGYPSSGYAPSAHPGGYPAASGYSQTPGVSSYAPAPAPGYGAPQQAYPSSGYPPQSPSGYPPQAPGYPQSYSSQGSYQGSSHSAPYPAPGGYPSQNYAPPGGYPPSGYPPPGAPPAPGSYPAYSTPYPGSIPGPTGPIYGAPPPGHRDYHGQ